MNRKEERIKHRFINGFEIEKNGNKIERNQNETEGFRRAFQTKMKLKIDFAKTERNENERIRFIDCGIRKMPPLFNVLKHQCTDDDGDVTLSVYFFFLKKNLNSTLKKEVKGKIT